MKNKLVFISRILVGALFIISGLIKANDALGFSYKLEEYFGHDALNWSIFTGMEVGLAMGACIGEIILGVALLAGEKIKLTIWSTLLLMIFFTFLTGYTALGNWFFENPKASLTGTFEGIFGFNARADIHYFKDCGCFGDAIKLTPMQSFLKDVVLMVFTLIIFLKKDQVKPNNKQEDLIAYGSAFTLILLFSILQLKWSFPVLFVLIVFAIMLGIKTFWKSGLKPWLMAGVTLVISFWFTMHTYVHLPVRDFRPFAIGKSIPEGMKEAEELGLTPPKFGYIYTMKNKSTGEEIEITDSQYLSEKWWEKKEYEMDADKTQQVKLADGYEPPIHDFRLESMADGEDYTHWSFGQDYLIYVVMYNLSKTDESNMKALAGLTNEAEANGVKVMGLSASIDTEVEALRHKYQLAFPFFSCDATTLKTVIRSNPGIVLINKGEVIGKWHINDTPTFADVKSELIK